jgi:hypothetical protein
MMQKPHHTLDFKLRQEQPTSTSALSLSAAVQVVHSTKALADNKASTA